MTTIDLENAKQIRQPMDVIIQVLMEETATLTSTYTGEKVADGVLNQPDWEMRKLADLQWNGFELDGSAVLYDSTVTASAANGKIGVRGNIGQPVTVSVTASASVDRLTVSATGCRAVEYNGVSYSMRNGYAIIPIGGTSAVFVFQPETDTKRVEVSDIRPGVQMRITNDNLISAVVSLRSDLSILEPTLPESEINIEAYMDEDYSELLASIPDETPITYQAGYPGDMSPLRKFYLAEQITWADNIMSIHAVDAVHLLDGDSKADICSYMSTWTRQSSLRSVTEILRVFLYDAGISYENPDRQSSSYIIYDQTAQRDDRGDEWITLYKQSSVRDIIAKLTNYLHQDLPSGLFSNRTNVWLSYVDAGIPTIYFNKPIAKWDVYENDTGEGNRNVSREINRINVERSKLTIDNIGGRSKGSGTWIYGSGAFLQYDGEPMHALYVRDSKDSFITGLYEGLPDTINGVASNPNQTATQSAGDVWYMIGDIPEGILIRQLSGNTHKLYNQVIPWTAAHATLWRQDYGSSRDDQTLTLTGTSFEEHLTNNSYGSGDNQANIKEEIIVGKIGTRGDDSANNNYELYPSGAYESLLQRSNITGSFTWKGDPRMQPRDVFTFHRLDGTDEECTLENITITHEKGGTSAEITYRKGVC